jgi:hypothetical protein
VYNPDSSGNLSGKSGNSKPALVAFLVLLKTLQHLRSQNVFFLRLFVVSLM